MSEVQRCPMCGSAMEETYLGYVCSNTWLEDPCSFRIAKHRFHHISAAMELANATAEFFNSPPMAPKCRLQAAGERVLEVFK